MTLRFVVVVVAAGYSSGLASGSVVKLVASWRIDGQHLFLSRLTCLIVSHQGQNTRLRVQPLARHFYPLFCL